jgi:xanthine dehydrogenase iron-sulfur cluster and FAD-binding subunit A
MDVALPRTLEEALELAASNPGIVPIAGGTDVMVELNMDLGRPETLMDVSRLPELGELRRENGHLFLGAGVTYARIMRELPGHTALVQASRSVGSPQIRNRGTAKVHVELDHHVGPAGDRHDPWVRGGELESLLQGARQSDVHAQMVCVGRVMGQIRTRAPDGGCNAPAGR